MRNSLLLLTLAILLANPLFSQNFEDPVEYNNFIVSKQSDVVEKSMEYVSLSVHSQDEGAVDAKRREVVRTLEKGIRDIEGMPAYKGDARLKNEALDVLRLYLEVYTADFNEAALLKKDRESSFEAMEKYFKAQEKAERKLAQAGEQFSKAQDAYAKKYELLIKEEERESELKDKLTIIADVNEYTHKVFLLYFKPFKIDAAFLDAFNRQKPSAMESKRQELLKTADAALVQLDLVGPFQDDKKYLEATQKVLQQYVDFAKGDYKELVRIMENKDALTQEDVDKVNSIIENYNKTMQTLIQGFNEENSAFLQRHIPR